VKFRPYAAVVAALATAAVSLTVAPAQAAATDPVTNLQVSQIQVGQNLAVTATWTANPDATNYHAFLTNQADGNGAVLAFDDGPETTATISTSSLATGETYWIAVQTTTPASTVTTKAFVAATLDLTGPTGTYKLNRTSGFLLLDFSADFDESEAAAFTAIQTSVADLPAPGPVTRTIQAGDGSAPRVWTTSTAQLIYHAPGTFTPKVRLTDQYGNQSTISLPAITVKRDKTNPTVRISTPAKPTKVASWRRISGTATDAGTGIDVALAFVVQKRGRTWYTYDFGKKKWLKGTSNLTKTINRSKARPAQMKVSAKGTWTTPVLKGLRKGALHVEAAAFDKSFNIGEAPKVNRILH
jgi:hypothetical protein